jgi:glycosyltransferase involved in cell wall biosynthesis
MAQTQELNKSVAVPGLQSVSTQTTVPSLSIVVPVYNGALSIRSLIEQLAPLLPMLATQYEVILVEDDSRDNSWEVVRQITQDYAWVRGLRLMRNYGQHNALLCGIRAAQYEITVTMDDDLQHPPEEVATLLNQLAQGYDVVYGRPQQQQHGLWRNIASQITKLALQGAMGADTARNISAFRAFHTYLREAFANYRSPHANIDVLLTWGTTRFIAIPVRHLPRQLGISNYTFRKLLTHTFNMVTGFSSLPLQIASLLGFMMTVFGILLLIYIVIIRLFLLGYEVPGFTFLASVVVIFSGAQMFALGIIGEYLARIHFRTMDRPTYVIRQDTSEAQD